MKSIGIIGFGNMGESIASGLRRSSKDVEILVMDPVEQRRRVAADRYRAVLHDAPRRLLDDADITVLAVKPQILPQLVANIGDYARGKRFVSVAAGVPLAFYRKALHTNEIVRFMPNIAATVGRALVAVCHAEPIERTTLDFAFRIAEAIGDRLVVPERSMSAITGLSGSGIAYVFALAHAMALGGTYAGLPYTDSLTAAIEVIGGAAELMRADGSHPVELLSRVTSPAGTTIEGIAELEAHGFTSAVMKAVVAAAERADELEKD